MHRIVIRAPVTEVYRAIATADGVAGWWTTETSGADAVGSTVTVGFRGSDGTEIGSMDYEVTRLEPDRRVRWRFLAGPPEWIGTDVTFELSQEGDMTIVNFGHRNWRQPVEFMGHCSTKWATFLLSLKDLVETGNGRPSPDDLKIDNWN